VNALVGPLIAIAAAAAALNPPGTAVVALTALLVLHLTVSELIAKVVDIASQSVCLAGAPT